MESLRDNYRQELRKLAKFLKSGSGCSDIYKRKWVYMEQMSCLKNIMTLATMTGSLSQLPNTRPDGIEYHDTDMNPQHQNKILKIMNQIRSVIMLLKI